MVLVLEQDDQPSVTIAGNWNANNNKPLKIVELPAGPEYKLGQLRNLGIEAADGRYFCQWDDDDWYHPQRLSKQYNYLVAAGNNCLATVLEKWIIFDAVHQQSYLSCRRHWEGSLLCDRNFALQHKYQNLDKGEDTPLIATLIKQQRLALIARHAYLYIYTFHGANTWDFGHFNGFMRYSCPLKAADNESILHLLEKDPDASPGFLEKIY